MTCKLTIMIDVFPFLIGRNSSFDYHKMVLPSFIKGEDDYAFEETTIGKDHEYDTIYHREIITSDGKKWRSFQWKHKVNKGTPTQRPVFRVDGFIVRKEDARKLDLSKSTLEQIKDHLTPFFEKFQNHSRRDGIRPVIITEPLRLPSRVQGTDVPMKELPLYDVAESVAIVSGESAKRNSTRKEDPKPFPLAGLFNGAKKFSQVESEELNKDNFTNKQKLLTIAAAVTAAVAATILTQVQHF